VGEALLRLQVADEVEAATLIEGLLREFDVGGVELGDDVLGSRLEADDEDLRGGGRTGDYGREEDRKGDE
jgi:hypothetical protein